MPFDRFDFGIVKINDRYHRLEQLKNPAPVRKLGSSVLVFFVWVIFRCEQSFGVMVKGIAAECWFVEANIFNVVFLCQFRMFLQTRPLFPGHFFFNEFPPARNYHF